MVWRPGQVSDAGDPEARSGREPGAGPIRVALLGSGGSIGRQAVDVLTRHADMFRVVALATGTQAALLEEQARTLRPGAVSLAGGAQGRPAARLVSMVIQGPVVEAACGPP